MDKKNNHTAVKDMENIMRKSKQKTCWSRQDCLMDKK